MLSFAAEHLTLKEMDLSALRVRCRVGGLRYSFGLPSWSSGEESALGCNGHGFDLWSGTKILHAALTAI